jgi:hypothetical protein
MVSIAAASGCRQFFRMLPTPPQIFAKYERGEIGLPEVHDMMARHAQGLIEEMEEDYQNPAAAFAEYLLANRAMSKLARKHGAILLRQTFHALSEVEDFPPAHLLWNALHLDVPLHCFTRIRRAPVFRVLSMQISGSWLVVVTEHGPLAKQLRTRRKFMLQRNALGKLRVIFNEKVER